MRMSSPAIASSNHRPKPVTASSRLNVLTWLSLRGWRAGQVAFPKPAAARLPKRGRENVMFLRDAVHPGERFMAAKRKAHLQQDTTSDRRRSPSSAGRIHPHHVTLPRPCRRNLETGAHPQRPRQPGLRPDPGGDRSDVATAPPRMPIPRRNCSGAQKLNGIHFNGIQLPLPKRLFSILRR